MKRYLYKIDGTYCEPLLPKVFARKSAKALRRNAQREHAGERFSGRYYKYQTRKSYATKDGTPHGYATYWDWRRRKEELA